MYKPKKEQPAPTSNRQRLPQEPEMPGLKRIKEQFEIAKTTRGVIVELPWTGAKPGQSFMLMVQWEGPAEFPVWTLYEEGGAQSKMHWSQTFPPTDLQLMYDVLSMSVETVGQSSAIPDELKPTGDYLAELDAPAKPTKPAHSGNLPTNPALAGQPALFTPNPAPAQTQQQHAPQQHAPAQHAAQHPPQMAPQSFPQPQPYPQQVPPGYPQPQYPPQNPYPQQVAGYPPPYPAPYPPMQPQNYPPPMQPQQQYNQMPGAPTPWQQGFGPGTSHAGLPAQGGYGSNSSSASELKPIDYNSMMQKRSNVLIGTLLVEAGLVTDPTLNAALKIQELVREDRMDQEQAFDALKRLHSMGSSIDDYLSASDFKAGRATNKPRTATVGSPQQTAARAPIDPERARDLHAAIDLLLKAGILNEADLKTANAVRAKHGGDISQILRSAGKLDATTFDAAMVCIKMVHSGKMKVEQCIIAINYCSRSRVGFDEAMEELNWPNPRK